MAISPERLNKAFQEEVDNFEKVLDNLLSNQKIAKGGSIAIDPPQGMNSSHFGILKTRYLSAGWNDVKWNSDQREGTWITFYY